MNARAALAALAIALMLSGCIVPDGPVPGPSGLDPWVRHRCDSSQAEPSGNAPLIYPFHGTASEAVSSLVAGVNDRILEEAQNSRDQERVWTTELGRAGYETGSERTPVQLWWRGEHPGVRSEGAMEAWVLHVLREFGVPRTAEIAVWARMDPSSAAGNYRLLHEGDPLILTRGTSGPVWRSPITGGLEISANANIGPIYDLRAAQSGILEEDAKEAAVAFHRCVRQETAPDRADASDVFYAGKGVSHESLAYVFRLSYPLPGAPDDNVQFHCGDAWWVFIDATTGAALSHDTPPCE